MHLCFNTYGAGDGGDIPNDFNLIVQHLFSHDNSIYNVYMLLRLNSHRPGLSVSGQYFQLMVLVAVVVKIEPRTRNIGNKNNKKIKANIVKVAPYSF